MVPPRPPLVATHRPVVGHDTAPMPLPLKLDTVHALADPVGLVEVSTFPAVSTAAQKVVVGQETPLIPLPANGGWRSTSTGAAHVNGETPANVTELATAEPPIASTTAQNIIRQRFTVSKLLLWAAGYGLVHRCTTGRQCTSDRIGVRGDWSCLTGRRSS